MNLDILILVETHCLQNDIIEVEDYKVIQYNRQNVSRNAIRGSGGVAILISNNILNTHKISAVYKGSDGQLAVKLTENESEFKLGIIANYLSPDTYHHGRDPEGFFNTNSVLWSDLQDTDLLIGGGDLNARTNDMLDYIPDLDGNDIPPRYNPDKGKNNHGTLFIDFLKANRALILNGRITPDLNDFTFVTTRGSSVPDYFFTSIDNLSHCKQVKTHLITHIINDHNLMPPAHIPDHSVLTAYFQVTEKELTEDERRFERIENNAEKTKKRNINKIDEKFFMSPEIQEKIRQTIDNLEEMATSQHNIDDKYEEIKKLFSDEIDKLPFKASSSNKQNKQFRKGQSFWNDELGTLWNDYCQKEKQYIDFKCNGRHDQQEKGRLRECFKQSQKLFDKRYRYFKRKSKAQELNDLKNDAHSNPNEMWKKIKRLNETKSTKAVLEIINSDKTITNDIKEVLNKWQTDISKLFSDIRDNPEVTFNDEFFNEVLIKKQQFEDLSDEHQRDQSPHNTSNLNETLSFNEVSEAIDKAKIHKAFLLIPNEAMKNLNAKLLLHKFYSVCFETGLCPSDWYNSDIKPIPKKDKDQRDPLNNRCITIMSCVAKIYSSILNNRIQKYLETNNLLEDEQNGFRAARSCIDHIFILCSVLRNRKETGKQTFLCFIDYKKAFDSVDRDLLLHSLSSIGIIGKMYRAISAMYKSPRARVILNEYETDYFDCSIGVKQGDSISPTLFACFVNSLSQDLKALNIGVQISNNFINDNQIDNNNIDNIADSFKICNLLYADDIVLLAENENDLQELINVVSNWCEKWRMEVNLDKTNIMHIRKKSHSQSNFVFLLGFKPIYYCRSYKYLGLTVNEFLDYEFSTNILSESGSRAMSAIITKMIKNGGFPMNVYKNLFESCVCSVTDYAGEIWGFKAYETNRQVQLKGARAFLGVSKQTPIPGLLSDINWLEPRSRTQVQMVRHFHRMLKMDNERLTKKVFLWDKNLNDSGIISTWSSEIKNILQRNGLDHIYDQNIFPRIEIIKDLKMTLLARDQAAWQSKCPTLPKLRTFLKFKDFHSDSPHIYKPLSFMQRKRISQFRLGTLNLRIETGRYVRPRLPPEERFCLICNNGDVEDEIHFLLNCQRYEQARQNLYTHIVDINSFMELSNEEKLIKLLNDASLVKQTAKFITSSFDLRSTII